jgi:hypothetical protein
MKILPVHLVKIRWLLSNLKVMNKNDATYVQEVTSILSKVNYQEACPLTIMLLEDFYNKYKTMSKEAV